MAFGEDGMSGGHRCVAPNCSSYDTRSRFCGAGTRGRAWTGPTGRPGRVDQAAAGGNEAASAGATGDRPALAATPGRQAVDLPDPHRTPAAARDVAALIERLATQNPSWGYTRIQPLAKRGAAVAVIDVIAASSSLTLLI
jgi:hypothetical protein